ncbi:hypothetical protein SAMN05421810_103348 [Amycolatopsis arida]|uniref:MOSC domain-containing protein n=1 Tax=Amycolatopsis arida TaxID=587909 RepID=A0A1I5T0Q9_9PSEU|nr:MOSC N-terminal beta barrel domain-containing protein [Amycolatopsis arida]TDX96273.1 hypothetical protein CLV69_103410 [Amycolatopsis arida]SFP76644.1 hypothetical protein SAMN05421810_103348 [Amycolatopsis arida]
MVARVAQLVYYPVKGCAGTPVPAAEVTPAGLRNDRGFMVVAEDGGFRSQRRHPALATVRPTLTEDGTRLVLRAPGRADLDLPVAEDGPRRAVSVFRWDGKGVDQGDAAAEWFGALLGAPSRLVRVPPDHQRETTGATPGTAGFADSDALLVVGESSLDLLNERIAAAGGQPVPVDRFRPNVVVGGWDEPHTEDRIRRAEIGDVELAYSRECVRCAVPTVDQETGTRSGPEPVRTLATYRRAPEGGVTFGAKLAVLRAGRIAVGDEVRVVEWA